MKKEYSFVSLSAPGVPSGTCCSTKSPFSQVYPLLIVDVYRRSNFGGYNNHLGTFTRGSHMPAELRCRVQRTSTFLTQKCAIARMRAHVIVKRACACERTPTETAFERPVVSVCDHVGGEF